MLIRLIIKLKINMANRCIRVKMMIDMIFHLSGRRNKEIRCLIQIQAVSSIKVVINTRKTNRSKE